MNIHSEKKIDLGKIRKQYSGESKTWLFSVIDVLGVIIETTDPRNYWKVQKNRLKKEHFQLVTNCNQLKMPGVDGKMYLTDVADVNTLLELAEFLAPDKVDELEEILSSYSSKNELHDEDIEYELLVDVYEHREVIHIQTMLAGVSPNDVSVVLTCDSVEIIGKRKKTITTESGSDISNELLWGTFCRKIKLPYDVDIDNAESEFALGLLEIKIPKINKLRSKILKIKTLSSH